ncbi:MAG: class II aldolase/adducin family protein [Chthoniobacterales bacterium]|nr:class II aldolase/adducin family protein [Chthoniobacterales bacterium]
MNETGVVKFHYEATGGDLAPFPGFEKLNAARQELRRLGLLGVDASGIGFGNISLRDGATDSFYITGTGTGALPALDLPDLAKVSAWDFERNWLRCEGRALASAESLTHAAVYAAAKEVRVVVHGHDSNLWRNLRDRGLATRSDVAYGTPEMALEVQRLFRQTDVESRKIFAMSGHTDGIVAFAQDFDEALAVLAKAGP